MRIVADRFAVDAGGGPAIDLATGERTALTIASTTDAAADRRWLCRCDEMHRLRHPSLAVLADYGLLGTDRRFEAWHCGGPWRGSTLVAARTGRAALAFLHAI